MNEYKLLLSHSQQTDWAEPPFLLETTCGAVGGGMFLAGAVIGSTWACALGWLLAVACKGFFLLSDLGVKEKCLKVMLRPTTSWVSFGAWALLVFGVFGFIHIIQMMLAVPREGSLATVITTLSMLSALIIITYDGLILLSSKAIAAWNSGMLAPLFAANALAAGCSVLLPFYYSTTLMQTTFALLSAELIILISHLLALHRGPTGARASLSILCKGSQRNMFLGGTVLAGIIAPLFFLSFPIAGTEIPSILLLLNAALNLGGVYCMRTSLVKSGVTTPVL